MARRDGAEVRKQRIQETTREVLSLLHTHGELPLSKTVASLEYKPGLTREKIMEYLAIADAVGRFIINVEEDKIRPIVETSQEDE